MDLEKSRPFLGQKIEDKERFRCMAIKIGINGFGRIGRVLLRILMKSPEKFDVCGINLRKADIDYMVYLLKYDSVFRNFEGTVENLDGNLVVNGHKDSRVQRERRAMIPWSQCGASIFWNVPAPITPPRRHLATSRAAPSGCCSPPRLRMRPRLPSSMASTVSSTGRI